MPFDTFFPAGFSLETSRVVLKPLVKEDAAMLRPIARSPLLWTYFTMELNDETQLQLWMEKAVTEHAAETRVPFTIVEKHTGNLCGSTSYANISFFDKRIEIGYTWLGEQYLSSGINRHCKYALLQYAFETMQFERVEIKTDNLNERAKQAIRKIGGIEEGILRSHMQMPHNRRRDSVFFSILKNEWPAVKALKVFENVL